MFNIIEPKNHDLFESKIESLLKFLRIYQSFKPLPEIKKNATFIIAEDEKHGVYGGAIVYSQDVRDLYQKLANPLLEFLPEKQQIWCSRLCFCLEQNDGFFTLETLELCESFYLNLYNALSEVGKKKGTDCLALTLGSQEYRNTIAYGHWSYILEVSPDDDYRFHGLLALNRKKEKILSFKDQEQDFDFNFNFNDQSQPERPVQ